MRATTRVQKLISEIDRERNSMSYHQTLLAEAIVVLLERELRIREENEKSLGGLT
jgi:hypothetical protein